MNDDDLRQTVRTVTIAAVGAAIGCAYGLKQRRVHIIDLNGSLADQEEDRP